MADYGAWNGALIDYFTAGAPRGASIFLAATDAVLREIWERLGQPHPLDVVDMILDDRPLGLLTPSTERLDPVIDFQAALRAHVVQPNRRGEPEVLVARVAGVGADGRPRGVGLLAALVLAATQMAEDEAADITGTNYFQRLRTVLGFPPGDGRPPLGNRPPGLARGEEAEGPLWQTWNQWVQSRGFLPTAAPGSGPTYYTNYALSQSLLRQGDEDRLCRLFFAQGWDGEVDAHALAGRLLRQGPALSAHLRRLLEETGPRYDAVVEAIAEVYAEWRAQGAAGQLDAGRRPGRATLSAGLWRQADPFTGEVTYHAYPRAPRRLAWQVDTVTVELPNGCTRRLGPERPGWLDPLDPLTAAELAAGVRYPTRARVPGEPAGLDAVVLPARPVWVLVPDPDFPEAGGWATWEAPPLGTRFLVLAQATALPELHRLREERLIEWSGEPAPCFGGAWVEVPDCQVLSEAWGAPGAGSALVEALRPRAAVGLGLAGGLRVPRPAGWLEGLGPRLTVFAFEPAAEVVLRRAADEATLFRETCPTGQPIHLPWADPGDYRVEATCAGETTRRLVRIVAWSQLEAAPRLEAPVASTVGAGRVRGAAVEVPAADPWA